MRKERKKLQKKPSPNLKPAVEKIKKIKIRVIGVGGGGGSIVSEIASRVKKATFVAANTDLQALKKISPKVTPFQFGEKFTQGLGTGMDRELAEKAAQAEKEKIEKICQGQDLCIILACLGGGTGSGAAPIFAKISKNLGNLTYGIFTLPFKFEGEKKMKIAKEALQKLRPNLNAISVIPNERIFQLIDKATPLMEALSVINKKLAESLEGLIETISRPGLINIDFADLKTIFIGKGKLTYLNTTRISKNDDSLQETIEKVLNSPFYPYTIKGAKGILFNITGRRNLNLGEVSQISKAIFQLSHPEAKIIFGVSPRSDQSHSEIKITLLATGCQDKLFPLEIKKERLKEKPSPTPKEKKEKTQAKKIKVEIKKETKEKSALKPKEEKKSSAFNLPKEKVRKNALQIKKELEEEERKMLEKEKFWETPAFLRKKKFFPQ